jgi:hypothetical protein
MNIKKKISDLELLKEASNGMSRYGIAKKYGIQPSCVSRRLTDMGFPKKPFINKKEWKKMVKTQFNNRHIAINWDVLKELGFNQDDHLLYKEHIENGKLIIEVKKE